MSNLVSAFSFTTTPVQTAVGESSKTAPRVREAVYSRAEPDNILNKSANRRSFSSPNLLASDSEKTSISSSNPPSSPTSAPRHPAVAKPRQKVAPFVVATFNGMAPQRPIAQKVGTSSRGGEGASSSFSTASADVFPSPPATPPSSVKFHGGGSRSQVIVSKKSLGRLMGDRNPLPESPRSLSDRSADMSHTPSKSFDNLLMGGLLRQSTSKSSNESNKLTVRMVGRGGAGARLRAPKETVAAKPIGIDLHLQNQQEHSIPVRPMGRGGMGSRPKNAKPKSEEKKSPSTPDILGLLNIRKSKKDKGKGKGREAVTSLYIHSSNPRLLYQASNGSSETLSTIHFEGESGGPPPDFFNKGARRHRVGIRDPDTTSLPSPLSATSSQFDFTDEEYRMRTYERSMTPLDHRMRNASKLARTLGDVPTGTDYEEHIASRAGTPDIVKKNRRRSLTLSTLSTISTLNSVFIRPTPKLNIRDSLASHNSMSTLTSDQVHYHDLNDRLSQLTDGSETSSHPSPIMFSPPTPLPDKDAFHPTPEPESLSVSSSSSQTESDSISTSATTSETEGDSVSSPTTPTTTAYEFAVPQVVIPGPPNTPLSPISRSKSLMDPMRRSVLMSGHGYSASVSVPTNDHDTIAPLKNPSPLRGGTQYAIADWLSSSTLEEGVIKITGPSPVKPGAWTGEWNVGMPDVIRGLRDLR